MSRNKKIFWIAVIIATQVAFFWFLFAATPALFGLQLALAMPMPIIVMLIAGKNKKLSTAQICLSIMLPAAIAGVELWGVTAMRHNYVGVCQVAADGSHHDYWSRSTTYTRPDGTTESLQTCKEHFYVDNNSPRRLLLYSVEYSYGRQISQKIVDTLDAHTLTDIYSQPNYMFQAPTSKYNGGGDTKPSNLHEDYLCLDFLKE
ncbi:MAG: hypothetical protein K5864_09545 [Bacteroidales bacterium]|nr:hypothetical protein [Bacteroidales bacterium]